jgi:phospholipid/cholesterol/gamma-HCH transport system substrate-binding protein
MIRKNLFNLISGAAVILVAIAFLVFMRWQTGTGSLSAYPMSIEVAHADQLNIGTDVRIAGVTVGKITSLSLEPRSYRVKASLYIKDGISIPVDSRVRIVGAMMSNPYVSIEPGHSTMTVPEGGTLITR